MSELSELRREHDALWTLWAHKGVRRKGIRHHSPLEWVEWLISEHERLLTPNPNPSRASAVLPNNLSDRASEPEQSARKGTHILSSTPDTADTA